MMIRETGGYRAWLSSRSKNIITHFKAIGCLSSNKVRALTCTLMKTGWPLSNRDGRDRWGSKTKPAEASTLRAAVNSNYKQNASCTQIFRGPWAFWKHGSSTAAPLGLANLQGFRRGTNSCDFIMSYTHETNVLYIFREKCVTVRSQSARKSDRLNRPSWVAIR